MTGLAFWDNGFRVMSANKPIHGPTDMKGLKIRINSSKVNEAITYSGYAVVANKKFRDGLPPDIRSALEGAMMDATLYNDEFAQKDTAVALAAIKASGKTSVYTPTPAEKEAWSKAMLPVQQEMAGRVGKDTVEARRKEVAAVATK